MSGCQPATVSCLTHPVICVYKHTFIFNLSACMVSFSSNDISPATTELTSHPCKMLLLMTGLCWLLSFMPLLSPLLCLRFVWVLLLFSDTVKLVLVTGKSLFTVSMLGKIWKYLSFFLIVYFHFLKLRAQQKTSTELDRDSCFRIEPRLRYFGFSLESMNGTHIFSKVYPQAPVFGLTHSNFLCYPVIKKYALE